VLGRRWDYLAWNRASCAVFGDLGSVPRPARNHLWLTFMDHSRRELITDWDRSHQVMVAKFRADSARHIGDPSFDELIESLRQASPEFCKAWKRHEVARSGEGRKELEHPVAGTLTFENAVFNPAEAPEQRLILYTPVPEDGTPERLAELLEPDVEPASIALVGVR